MRILAKGAVLEKIVLVCADKEKQRQLEMCLEILFPECSLEILGEGCSPNPHQKIEDERIEGEI
jgi:hypothetical protein